MNYVLTARRIVVWSPCARCSVTATSVGEDAAVRGNDACGPDMMRPVKAAFPAAVAHVVTAKRDGPRSNETSSGKPLGAESDRWNRRFIFTYEHPLCAEE